MQLDIKHIAQFQKKILDWYSVHQRNLPWRKTRDPYKILVSEMMSQQTQISRVIPKYEGWLRVFPTVEDLAQAKVSEVLKMWSGLGYNRRALNLQKTAQVIMNDYQGQFPKNPEELEKLPGIGKYTSKAVACFAFDQQVAVVDTNIRKVILIEVLKETKKVTEKEIERIAQQLLPEGKASIWNQALMDYAGAVLKEHKIPISKQSHFFTSNRYYRGQIVKLLANKETMTKKELFYFFQKEGRGIDREKLAKIVNALEKDGFVMQKNDEIRISDL